MHSLFSWIFEDHFKLEPASDYFTLNAKDNVLAVLRYFRENSKLPESFHQKNCVAQDESFGENFLEAITSIDDHFKSHVFEKVDTSREGQEVGVKAKSPIPSIQITGMNTRVGKMGFFGPCSRVMVCCSKMVCCSSP